MDDRLERLRALVARENKLHDITETLKAELEKASDDYKKVTRELIPDLMAEIGVSEITVDGQKVELRQELNISMKAGAFSWLDENGYGGLIKTDVITKFSRDERDDAVETMKLLQAKGYEPELKENVHWATLKSWGKERMVEGEPIPSEQFEVFPFTEAKIKQAKK